MRLTDPDADAEFIQRLDARLPYADRELASALIREAWATSLNAAFMVLHELCRPPRKNVPLTRARLAELIAEWEAGPEHALKAPVLRCACALRAERPLAVSETLAVMQQVAGYPGQFNALAIASLAVDPDHDDAPAVEAAYERIAAGWRTAD